jgi:16S rRNA (guanine527-N7)-methyltransferase
MTEDEARCWVLERWGAAVEERLAAFVALVVDENQRQNLIAPSTVPIIWSRHIVDSLQLAALVPAAGSWIDIGSGGGFPGLALAIAGATPMLLVEPRRRRVDFLRHCIDRLGLVGVSVAPNRIEQVTATADVITARAVATVENLLRDAVHCATTTTRWLLPRGSIDIATLPALLRRYELVFHVEQSLTHPDSAILVLESTRR